ncbi:mitochondrial carrier domain-containing protein [Tribonema minus]|uniref:Mitochondrial carrier domain-containing protein n=1 Tax=Tribonema minus TaxID=303371 RepID=A0A835Z6G9_9STRA|nr:mitochondrial carrier domain-containing protein [Tribonema minus]
MGCIRSWDDVRSRWHHRWTGQLPMPYANALHTYSGALQCCRQTVSKEGFGALFKGCIPPLASAPFINAIAFTAYARANEWLLSRHDGKGMAGRRAEGSGLSFWETFAAGSCAGACQTVVLLPSDNIKTKLQVQVGSLHSSQLRYKGPLDCARQLVRTQGPRALLAGGTATVCRELPALGTYFSVYEHSRARLRRRGAGEGFASFAAGGLAGCSSWLAIAPMDTIKSRQQLRAFPVNAAIFPTYEYTARLLQMCTALPATLSGDNLTGSAARKQPATA